MNFYSVYVYVFPVLAFPLAYALWLQRYAGDHRLVVLMLSMHIILAYVVPGIGTRESRVSPLAAANQPRDRSHEYVPLRLHDLLPCLLSTRWGTSHRHD
jgi:hypothetical protein